MRGFTRISLVLSSDAEATLCIRLKVRLDYISNFQNPKCHVMSVLYVLPYASPFAFTPSKEFFLGCKNAIVRKTLLTDSVNGKAVHGI